MNAPDWATSSRFEVLAKASGPLMTMETPPYLQRLLAERFGLRVHRESRKDSVYARSTPLHRSTVPITSARA